LCNDNFVTSVVVFIDIYLIARYQKPALMDIIEVPSSAQSHQKMRERICRPARQKNSSPAML
jgi:hypothetical protein